MREQHPNILSASTMIGDQVTNAQQEDLGDIKDLMVDLDKGSIAYAVVSMGGFLGMGNKLFAVPWQALDVDTDRKVIMLNVDKDVLEDAPGFDKNDWPSQPDRTFINRVHTHYGYEPYYASTETT